MDAKPGVDQPQPAIGVDVEPAVDGIPLRPLESRCAWRTLRTGCFLGEEDGTPFDSESEASHALRHHHSFL
ncbi:hypothetical protein D9M69_281580 [compost metagenome]